MQVLAFNDLHGTLEPPQGGGGRVASVPAGGMAYLASHLARLEAGNPHTVVVSAGDNIGASSLLSSLFHDEPTIEALNAIGLDFSAVGNHELDEGWAELARMQRGGCHPRDGCQDGTPFSGASFQFLTANVRVDPARVDPAALASSGWTGATPEGATLFPPYAVRAFGGVKVGFVGLTLRGVPSLVGQSMVRGLTFAPEAAAANVVVDELVRQGVRAIIVLIHEGGSFTEGVPDPCADLTGAIVGIVGALSPEVDVVVSGHTHRDYTCTIGSALVTSAGSFGRMITDIDLSVDRRSGQVLSKRARNVVVTRDVPRDAAQAAIVSRYGGLSAKEVQRPVGSIAAPISRDAEASGESPLGRVLTDAFLSATRPPEAGGAVVALINAGGIRSDLTAAGGGGGTLTFGDVYRVMPFGNQWLVKTLTGEALIRLLEEQFDNPRPGDDAMLQVSDGFTYCVPAVAAEGASRGAGLRSPLRRAARSRRALQGRHARFSLERRRRLQGRHRRRRRGGRRTRSGPVRRLRWNASAAGGSDRTAHHAPALNGTWRPLAPSHLARLNLFWGRPVKRSSLLKRSRLMVRFVPTVLALLLGVTASAAAQGPVVVRRSTPVQVRADGRELRRDTREIRADRREVRRDTRRDPPRPAGDPPRSETWQLARGPTGHA